MNNGTSCAGEVNSDRRLVAWRPGTRPISWGERYGTVIFPDDEYPEETVLAGLLSCGYNGGLFFSKKGPSVGQDALSLHWVPSHVRLTRGDNLDDATLFRRSPLLVRHMVDSSVNHFMLSQARSMLDVRLQRDGLGTLETFRSPAVRRAPLQEPVASPRVPRRIIPDMTPWEMPSRAYPRLEGLGHLPRSGWCPTRREGPSGDHPARSLSNQLGPAGRSNRESNNEVVWRSGPLICVRPSTSSTWDMVLEFSDGSYSCRLWGTGQTPILVSLVRKVPVEGTSTHPAIFFYVVFLSS